MAELMLKDMLQKLGLDHQVEVRSAGIASYAWDDALISHDALILLRASGIDAEAFRSTDLKRHTDLLAAADLILTMTDDQLERLGEYPEAVGAKAYTLKAFAGEVGDIADPEGEHEEAYAECKVEVERCLKKAMPRIVPSPPR
jgi:protein-tyrosine-phosphatase